MQVRFALVASVLFSAAPAFAQQPSNVLTPSAITVAPVVQPPARTASATPAPGRPAPVTASTNKHGSPAFIELKDGTHITGQMASEGPITCGTALGAVEVPLGIIRGISWPNAEPGHATLILTNDDSLTATINVQVIPIKTEWGLANVKLSHIRSIILSADKLKWTECANGRLALVAAETSSSSATLTR